MATPPERAVERDDVPLPGERPLPPEPAAEEPTLALGTPPEELRPPLSVANFIRALQFPETPED